MPSAWVVRPSSGESRSGEDVALSVHWHLAGWQVTLASQHQESGGPRASGPVAPPVLGARPSHLYVLEGPFVMARQNAQSPASKTPPCPISKVGNERACFEPWQCPIHRMGNVPALASPDQRI